MFFKKETVYTDVLQEWRHMKCGRFNLFDKVIITGVNYKYSEGKFVGQEAVVIGWDSCNIVPKCVTKEGEIVYPKTCKLSYGEFQEEFEAIEEAKQKMQRAEELQKELEQVRKDAVRLYEKGKAVVDKRVGEQFGVLADNNKANE